MPDAYLDYAPLNVPKPVADGIWIVDGPEIAMDYGPLALPFPTRMTIVRLADGGLWVHSPIAWTRELGAALTLLGPVRHLIAPNTIHYWYLPEWAERFATAQVHLVPGLARRAKRPLPPGRTLDGSLPASWHGAIEMTLFEGDAITEAVFFHRPSATLILTDLIENFELRRVRSWWLRQAMRMAGAADPDGRAPVDLRLSFLRNRKAVRAAAQRMLAWNPERVLLAHGRCYLENGTEELRRAFRWVL